MKQGEHRSRHSTGRSSSRRCSTARIGGFDAIVGNPPFAGKNTIIAAIARYYLDWLQTLHAGAHGNADLVAHFFRRASICCQGGAFGLIATNTIRQGDTRATGLRPIRQAGGTIYRAQRRIKWPGEAAVVIAPCTSERSVRCAAVNSMDGQVDEITAFLSTPAATTIRTACRQRGQEL